MSKSRKVTTSDSRGEVLFPYSIYYFHLEPQATGLFLYILTFIIFYIIVLCQTFFLKSTLQATHWQILTAIWAPSMYSSSHLVLTISWE